MKGFMLLTVASLSLGACSLQSRLPSGKEFAYEPEGRLVPVHSGAGRVGDTRVYAPGIRFPLLNAPAYLNSQVYGVGGLYGEPGSLCDARNYQYPWKDTFCEKRGWSMPLCPDGKGHQGVDIRPATCEKNKYAVVAVEEGVISAIGEYTVYLRGRSGRTYRYLHMDPSSLQIRRGRKVKRGQVIGKVSNYMGNTKTSIHLHFDMKQTIRFSDGRSIKVYVPPYSSLVEAYKRLLEGAP